MSGETEQRPSDWTVETLKIHFEQRFIDGEKAVNAALAAAEKAVTKAEVNAEKWRENANEWRGAMSDRDRELPSRREVESAVSAIAARLDMIEKHAEHGKGERQGVGATANVLVVGLGVVLTLLLIVSTVIVIATR